MDSRQWTSEESGVTAARKKGKCEKKKKKKKKMNFSAAILTLLVHAHPHTRGCVPAIAWTWQEWSKQRDGIWPLGK
jgi:hypothetical protein